MAQSPKDKQPQDVPPARRGRAAALAADAGLVSATAFLRAGFADPTLVLRWDEIAGTETARLARPIRLSEGPAGGVLTLRAEPGAAIFLQHESRALCERINAYLGRPAIARLRFVQGAVTGRSNAPARRPRNEPVGPSDPARNYLGPEALREALLKLAQARQGRPGAPQD